MYNKSGLLTIVLSLYLLFFSGSAFAALDCSTIEGIRGSSGDIPYQWPVAAVCAGSDVNIRSGPVTDRGEILGSLQPGDPVYMEEFTENLYEGYPWAKVITGQGIKGYVNARYLELAPEAMTRPQRFLAAFNSSVFFGFDELAASYAYMHGNGFADLESSDRRFDGAKFKIVVGEYDVWAYCDRNENVDGLKIQMWGASVISSQKETAGLRLGQKMNSSALTQFHQDMESIGWYLLPGKNGMQWYRNREYLAELPNSKGFGFSCRDGEINGIWWCTYPAEL